jgi:hypothetical protein
VLKDCVERLLKDPSPQSTKDVLRFGIDGQSERNKAVYIYLVPYEGSCSGKRTLDGTPASRIVVVPCPVVSRRRSDIALTGSPVRSPVRSPLT